MTLPGYHDTMDISSQTSRFIAAHRNQDVRDLALSAKRVDGLDLPFALDQIAGWQTACRKLPQWAETDGIVYPPHISMEQCSSQFAAQYKAGIARRVAGAGGAMVDLTGGFGVDCSYIARGFSRAVYVERQPHLCELAAHNFRALGLPHMDVINGDAEDWLRGVVDSRAASADLAAVDSATAVPIALIYLDPRDVTRMAANLCHRRLHAGRTRAERPSAGRLAARHGQAVSDAGLAKDGCGLQRFGRRSAYRLHRQRMQGTAAGARPRFARRRTRDLRQRWRRIRIRP